MNKQKGFQKRLRAFLETLFSYQFFPYSSNSKIAGLDEVKEVAAGLGDEAVGL